jgi:hypothetical protein
MWVSCSAITGLMTSAGFLLLPAPISVLGLIIALLLMTNVRSGRTRGSFAGNAILAVIVAAAALYLSKALQGYVAQDAGLLHGLQPLGDVCWAWADSIFQRAFQRPSPLCRFLMHPADGESGLGFVLQGALVFTLFWSWYPFGTDYSQGIELIRARSPGVWGLFALSIFLSVAVAGIDRIAALYPGWQGMTEERPLLIIFVPLLTWPIISLQAGLSEYARKLNAT